MPKEPELINEIHNSNRILNIDAYLKEIIDYLKQYQDEHPAIKTAIEKLENI